jgi:competence protein ComGC
MLWVAKKAIGEQQIREHVTGAFEAIAALIATAAIADNQTRVYKEVVLVLCVISVLLIILVSLLATTHVADVFAEKAVGFMEDYAIRAGLNPQDVYYALESFRQNGNNNNPNHNNAVVHPSLQLLREKKKLEVEEMKGAAIHDQCIENLRMIMPFLWYMGRLLAIVWVLPAMQTYPGTLQPNAEIALCIYIFTMVVCALIHGSSPFGVTKGLLCCVYVFCIVGEMKGKNASIQRKLCEWEILKPPLDPSWIKRVGCKQPIIDVSGPILEESTSK